MTVETIFSCWATLPADRGVRRLEVRARHQADAILAAFSIVPNAVAMSAREITERPLKDALLLIDRRVH